MCLHEKATFGVFNWKDFVKQSWGGPKRASDQVVRSARFTAQSYACLLRSTSHSIGAYSQDCSLSEPIWSGVAQLHMFNFSCLTGLLFWDWNGELATEFSPTWFQSPDEQKYCRLWVSSWVMLSLTEVQLVNTSSLQGREKDLLLWRVLVQAVGTRCVSIYKNITVDATLWLEH